jgi:predicted secreted protein
MARQTNDTKASTDAVPPGRTRLRRLIIALTVNAFLVIGAFAIYAISWFLDTFSVPACSVEEALLW